MKALDSPLLNDNKITGAKNVLLLIVSGSQEITIDEIGEINDHIQNEAGHGANIIMGVGEDESLEESISVTIIATGFDIDQQNEISNTETKRVIHALEDIKHEELPKVKADNNINTASEIKSESIQPKAPEVVVHNLLDEEDDVVSEVKNPESNIILTNDMIRNLNVVYDEVLDHIYKEEDFVITQVNEPEEKTAEIETEEEQTTLTFDLPLPKMSSEDKDPSAPKKQTIYDLEDDVKDINVNGPVEIIPVTEANEQGEKRYALDDFMTYESSINETKSKAKPKVEEDVVFERKTVAPEHESSEMTEEVDPMTSPISELLKSRADERRRKMKDFNYKFNQAKIDEIEKEPAYKRQGVNLEDSQPSKEHTSSRTSVGTDDNDDIQLRSNNSFLHDNVD